MAKLNLFLDENKYPAKLLVSDVDLATDDEAYHTLLDGLSAFMDGDAKTLVISNEYDVKVHDRA